MRVAELYEPRHFRLVEAELAEPGPGEVQVRVHSVGICGSDRHYFLSGRIGDTPCVYPMVLGHEPTGTVVKAGEGVSGWSPGDRAALEPALYCYHCESCRTGHHNVCAHIRFLSMPGEPGFLRDRVNLPAANLLRLPEGLGMEEGTLFEPLAVVLHSMKFAAPAPGETAAVFGAGPIGLLTIAVLRLSGAGTIWAIEPVAARRELAVELGAASAIDPAEVSPVREILRETGGRGVDLAIDCAGAGEALNDAIGVTRNAGRVAITGIPEQARVALDFHTARRKELALFNVRRSNHESAAALELLRAHGRRFFSMLTHRFPLESVERAFSLLDHYDDNVGKVTIKL